jgi:hypothetical protein
VSVEPRRNHARVVQNQQVAGPQQRGKLGKTRVAQRAGRAVHNQHPALAALGRRLLRNQLRGQIKVEIGDAQAVPGFAFFWQIRHARGFPK